MKYFLAILASLFILGCASSQNKDNSASNSYNTKSDIVDEEFDLLIAPQYDYESDVPYAEQIKVTTKTTDVSVNNTTKPAKHPVSAN